VLIQIIDRYQDGFFTAASSLVLLSLLEELEIYVSLFSCIERNSSVSAAKLLATLVIHKKHSIC
jgi:hypothetical protein